MDIAVQLEYLAQNTDGGAEGILPTLAEFLTGTCRANGMDPEHFSAEIARYFRVKHAAKTKTKTKGNP